MIFVTILWIWISDILGGKFILESIPSAEKNCKQVRDFLRKRSLTYFCFEKCLISDILHGQLTLGQNSGT